MMSGRSGVRYSLGVAAAVALIVSCATKGADEGGPGGNCGPLPCPTGEDGADARAATADTGGGETTETGADDDAGGDDPADSGGKALDSGGGGDWVDMTNNATGCDRRGGVPCGWASTNNGSGNVCACRHGTWADGWTCEAPGAPTTAGPACPGVVGSDASVATDAGHPVDAGATVDGAVGWVDMTNDTAACEHRTGTPCGWTPTNNGAGYTCACRHGAWAEGWTCEPANAPSTPGPACPDAGP